MTGGGIIGHGKYTQIVPVGFGQKGEKRSIPGKTQKFPAAPLDKYTGIPVYLLQTEEMKNRIRREDVKETSPWEKPEEADALGGSHKKQAPLGGSQKKQTPWGKPEEADALREGRRSKPLGGSRKKQAPCGKSEEADALGEVRRDRPLAGSRKKQTPCGKPEEADPCGTLEETDPLRKAKIALLWEIERKKRLLHRNADGKTSPCGEVRKL